MAGGRPKTDAGVCIANLVCCRDCWDLGKLMFDILKQLNVNKENTSGSVSLLTVSIFN